MQNEKNFLDKPYLKLLKDVLENGTLSNNRTNMPAVSLFGTMSVYDVSTHFPLLVTKKMFWKGIVYELLWFISGNTNIKYLLEHNVHIWDAWAYENYKKQNAKNSNTTLLSLKEFTNKILTDEQFATTYGDLGPIYSKQWRNFNGIDQLKDVIEQIKTNPTSRRLIVSAWNPAEVSQMALPPCHTLFQFYVQNGTLSLQLYQRSADLFLGVPFNIASYSLLLYLVADVCRLKPGKFVHSIGVAHIYSNHIEQVKEQLTRIANPSPKLIIKKHRDNIFDFQFEDFELEDYNPLPAIKGDVAV